MTFSELEAFFARSHDALSVNKLLVLSTEDLEAALSLEGLSGRASSSDAFSVLEDMVLASARSLRAGSIDHGEALLALLVARTLDELVVGRAAGSLASVQLSVQSIVFRTFGWETSVIVFLISSRAFLLDAHLVFHAVAFRTRDFVAMVSFSEFATLAFSNNKLSAVTIHHFKSFRAFRLDANSLLQSETLFASESLARKSFLVEFEILFISAGNIEAFIFDEFLASRAIGSGASDDVFMLFVAEDFLGDISSWAASSDTSTGLVDMVLGTVIDANSLSEELTRAASHNSAFLEVEIVLLVDWALIHLAFSVFEVISMTALVGDTSSI